MKGAADPGGAGGEEEDGRRRDGWERAVDDGKESRGKAALQINLHHRREMDKDENQKIGYAPVEIKAGGLVQHEEGDGRCTARGQGAKSGREVSEEHGARGSVERARHL